MDLLVFYGVFLILLQIYQIFYKNLALAHIFNFIIQNQANRNSRISV